MTESLYDANDNLVDDIGYIAGGIVNQEWKERGDWSLFLLLLDEVEELKEAICTNGFNGSIQDKAVDVANFAMMIYDNCKGGK